VIINGIGQTAQLKRTMATEKSQKSNILISSKSTVRSTV